MSKTKFYSQETELKSSKGDHRDFGVIKGFITKICCFLLLLSVSSCSYHPRTEVPRPPPRPNTMIRPPEDFVIKKYPVPISEVSPPISTPMIKKTLIVIDAGHGGDDFGTRSASKPKYHEKSLNLTTALILSDFLTQLGYQTMMTRSIDEFIPLKARADFANKKEADFFVSVHYNSAPAKKAEGIEVFYYKSDENKLRSLESQRLASSILAQVTKLTHAKSRGVKHGNFAVIRETTMPAVLIEGGFLTNEEEMEKIKDPAYVKNVAWGIAQGIQDYLNMRQ